MNFFITGTDTSVGKTYVLSLILKYLKHNEKSFFVMKPVETGCAKRGGKLIPEDALKLSKIAGLQDNLDIVCPYRFETPVAPYVAAKLEGRAVDVQKIKNIFSSRLTVDGSQQNNSVPPVFVEGAGGLMVPVTDDFFMIDFPNLLGLSVILVSRLSLGTINHTLLSLAELKRRKIYTAGVILNDTEGTNTAAKKTNAEFLKEFTDVPVLGVIPHGFKNPRELGKHLNLKWLGV